MFSVSSTGACYGEHLQHEKILQTCKCYDANLVSYYEFIAVGRNNKFGLASLWKFVCGISFFTQG